MKNFLFAIKVIFRRANLNHAQSDTAIQGGGLSVSFIPNSFLFVLFVHLLINRNIYNQTWSFVSVIFIFFFSKGGMQSQLSTPHKLQMQYLQTPF